MRKLLTLFTFLAALLLCAGAGRAQFYYSAEQQFPLFIDSNRITLRFATSMQPQDQQSLLASIDRIVGVLPDSQAFDAFLVCSLSTSEGFTGFVDSLRPVDGISYVEPYYRDYCDSAFLVGARFVVAFDETLSLAQIDSINATYGAVIDRAMTGMPNVYVLNNTPASGLGVLDLANLYYELAETRYAHPDFAASLRKQSYKLYDHYGQNQLHTQKVVGDFNSATVWDFAGLANDTVVVAVMDDGVVAHEDLPAERLLPGYDYFWDVPDGSPGSYSGHGMACAGIIAASHTTDSLQGQSTSSGVISLNPNTFIKSLKIFEGDYPTSILATAQAFVDARAGNVDIISCSWGTGARCGEYPPDIPRYQWDALTNAIETTAETGRNGKGCPIIFAAGNSADLYDYVSYPACLEHVLSVGAIQLDDVRWPYSQYGNGLDLVAPSGDVCLLGDVWSLDQMDIPGYNPLVAIACYGLDAVTWDCPTLDGNNINYDCHFGGTSAAAPIVAGTASLLLAKDSSLTRQDVYNILLYSAQKNLEWGSLPKLGHVEYGYGRVDAFRAVLSLVRGDVNNDTKFNVSDCTHLIAYLFRDGVAPFPSPLLADCDCNGTVNVADQSYLNAHLFQGGPAPVRPCFEYGD